jgi:TRAP-type C4-dicarboxylate transport system permease small subunit
VQEKLKAVGGWLGRRAENVAVAMLAVMFTAFILQVLFRYVLNWPVGWASELTIVMWLWLVLWGAAFVVREREEIRFDIFWSSAGRRARRVMAILSALAVLFLYGWSLPAVWDYVTFMKVQETSYLDIRYDLLFSIYILFAVATLGRYAWLLVAAFRDQNAKVSRGDGTP